MSNEIIINSMYFNALYTILKGGKWMDKMNDMLTQGVFNDADDFMKFEDGLTDYLINEEERIFLFNEANLVDSMKVAYDDFVSEWHGLLKSMDWKLEAFDGDENKAAVSMNNEIDFPVSFYVKLYSNGFP